MKLILLILIASFSLTTRGAQQTVAVSERSYQIYSPKSDSPWLPITYALNGTFDVIQNPYWFSQNHYDNKVSELWRRVKSPDKNIKRDGGYSKFFQYEFFSSRVVPNIGLHFLGGAYDTLWLSEYFEHYSYPLPKAWAFLFTYIAHIGNEALEISSDEISSHDHIADLYFFDLAAFIMSQYGPFMDFLLDDMQMKAWHFNPMWDLDSDNFFNAGLNYVFRPRLAWINKGTLKPLIYAGMQNMAGASYQYQANSQVSLAAGLSLTNPLKQKGRFVTALFHEQNERLEASLFLNGSEDFRWRLNLYDNFFERFMNNPKISDQIDLALVIGQAKGPAYAVGLNFNMPFGLGGVKNSKRSIFDK